MKLTDYLIDLEGNDWPALLASWREALPEDFTLWLMIPLVDRCREAGIELEQGEAYWLRTPAVLGGDYDVDNIVSLRLPELYPVMADILGQVSGLPDGAQVKLVVE